MRKLKFIASKEIRHILRDPRSLIIAIAMPIMMTFLYGYAINLDIKSIKIAIMDFDHSAESRELAARFYNSGYFLPPENSADLNDPQQVLKSGDASAVLTINPGLSEAMTNFDQYELGLMIDGADANTASAIQSYSTLVVSKFMLDRLPENLKVPGVSISPQVYYNPDLKSSHFFVPGLIAVILMMISALLTSITIAREKETGTMEQLLTAPVTPAQIIIGKIIPYTGLALLDGILVLLFAVFYFGTPFSGSILLLLIFGLIYIVAALSIGVLISTLVKTQQVAMMIALTVTMLPSVMLSGFIFEIGNMPVILRAISHIIPARYFIEVIRGIMLRGSSLGVIMIQAVPLIIIAVVLIGAAAKMFKLKIG